uniref:Uncharacterized protein n=1 Tax=Ralstonia solanacearum TaxID=305 RepID=A0A0S4X0V0_RALSL|nr:protein of unknown function [Ralstonia solanacearum]
MCGRDGREKRLEAEFNQEQPFDMTA